MSDSSSPGWGTLMRRPSAFLPMVMSALALVIVLIHVTRFGAAREADEGAAAHAWQLLMAGQLPLIGWFALHGLRARPGPALVVLGLQLVAAGAAAAPVWLLHL